MIETAQEQALVDTIVRYQERDYEALRKAHDLIDRLSMQLAREVRKRDNACKNNRRMVSENEMLRWELRRLQTLNSTIMAKYLGAITLKGNQAWSVNDD